MDNYLMDREALGQLIDELIKKKPLPISDAKELTEFREKQIANLDDKISSAVFDKLTAPQREEINKLFEKNEEDPAVFEAFFKQSGINLENVIADTIKSFTDEFLGDKNV